MCEGGVTPDFMAGVRSKERVVSVRSVRGFTPPPSVFHCVAEAHWLVFFFFRWWVSAGSSCEGKKVRVPGHMR